MAWATKEKEREWAREYYQRRKDNPEYMRRRRADAQAGRDRRKGDPEYGRQRRETDKESRARLSAEVAALKTAPCTDCGQSYPPVVMDFDHVRGTKVMNVARLVGARRRAATLAEIAKCELVCANCHRLRTAARLEP